MGHSSLAWPCPVAGHTRPTVTRAPRPGSLFSCPPLAVRGGEGKPNQAADALCGPQPLGIKTSMSLSQVAKFHLNEGESLGLP